MKGWLLPTEVDVVINYAIEVASCGFPLCHKRLREHMNSICKACLGAVFPDEGVGKRWTDHFVEKFSDQLGTYGARPLDNIQGQAINPITNAAWFNLE
jgi:hypothetical protein